MNRFFLTVFLCLVLNAGGGRAEVIRLTSGQTVEGKVLKVQSDSVLVDAGVGTPVTYFRDEIKEILPDPEPAAPDPEVIAKADELEAQAVELIDADKRGEGMKLLQQALSLDPNSQRRMNYGSILFGNGVELFKQGKQEEGKNILRRSEAELKKAIKGFNVDKNTAFCGQAYFLLGEMYAHAFADAIQARKYYQKAVELSGHEGAKTALAKLPKNS